MQQTNQVIFSQDIYMKEIKVQDIPLDKNDIKLSIDAKEMMKLEFIRWMKNELNNYKPDDFIIPRLTKKIKKQVFLGLRNVFDKIENIKIWLVIYLTQKMLYSI
jgi:hypothetical protein